MKIDNSIAAVVTGGASGLGRASAEALAAAGVKVAVFDINEEAGEAFAKEIGGVFCNVNIMDEQSVLDGFAKARAAHGQERVVVHCAVVAGGGKTISCLMHLLPDRRKAPVVIYVPGMDQTKEVFPRAYHNIALSRGFHVCAMDGPGQGSSNLQKIRAVKDNYERAGAAVIGYLAKRPEVDAAKIAIYGISMGSYWSLRLSSYDHRAAAVVSGHCFDLERRWGDAANGTYAAQLEDPDVLPQGCHPYYFLFVDGDGVRHTYPSQGSLQLAVGEGMSCPVAYDPTSQKPSDCETGKTDCVDGASRACYTAADATTLVPSSNSLGSRPALRISGSGSWPKPRRVGAISRLTPKRIYPGLRGRRDFPGAVAGIRIGRPGSTPFSDTRLLPSLINIGYRVNAVEMVIPNGRSAVMPIPLTSAR